jgi:hypothetical protein
MDLSIPPLTGYRFGSLTAVAPGTCRGGRYAESW